MYGTGESEVPLNINDTSSMYETAPWSGVENALFLYASKSETLQ